MLAHQNRSGRSIQRPRHSVEIAPGVFQLRVGFVNVFLVDTGDGGWSLVDAGLPGYSGTVAGEAAALFGPDQPPRTIILTHGHFDHVGSLRALARSWDAPVFPPPLELPYLSGLSSYP